MLQEGPFFFPTQSRGENATIESKGGPVERDNSDRGPGNYLRVVKITVWSGGRLWCDGGLGYSPGVSTGSLFSAALSHGTRQTLF